MNSVCDTLKNPIILGIIALIITYSSLYYKEKQRKNNNPNSDDRKINITIPCIVAVMTWFITSGLFGNNTVQTGGNIVKNIDHISNIDNIENSSASYHFIKKGDIVIPNIDVFLDVGGF